MRSSFAIVFCFCVITGWSQKDTIIQFSQKPGFYSQAIELTLSAPSGAKIYYSTDGSKPNSEAFLYKQPISIETNTVVKAKYYLNGTPSPTETATYIIGRKPNLPVVSISTHPDYFFSGQKGIYVKGCCADTVQPYKGANFWKEWEHPIHVEYFDENGVLAFSQDAGVRIFGGFSKGLPMKSLSIIARKKYGKKYFKYPLFKEKKIKKYKSFILRNSGGDFNKTHFRDALITQLTRPTKLPIQAYQPVVLYINGAYWGIHNAREKINEYYLKANFGANPDSVTIMKHRYDLQDGERKHYKKLLDFLRKNDLSDAAVVASLRKQMNIENFIDYNITQVYADNRDAGGNIRYWRPMGDSGVWNWILFDTDMSMGISDWKGYKTNTLVQMTSKTGEAWPNPAWSTFIVRKLLENEKLQNYYAERFTDYLNTIFSEQNVLHHIDSIQELLRPEMEHHQKKWGSKMERWDRNVNVLRDFARNRPSYLRGFLAKKFNLGDTVHVSTKNIVSSNYTVWINDRKQKKEFDGVFFTQQPLRIKIEVKPGYQFVGWKKVDQSEKEITLFPNEGLIIEPEVIPLEKSSHWNDIVLNEIAYSKKKSGDWIEIYNASEKSVSINNWKIYVPEEGIYPIDVSLEMHPDEFFVLAENKEQLKTDFPSLDLRRTLQLKDLKLKSKGFSLLLLDEEEKIVDSLSVLAPPKKGGISLTNVDKNNHQITGWTPENASPNTDNPLALERKTRAKNRNSILFYGGLSLMVLGTILLFIYRKRKKTLV